MAALLKHKRQLVIEYWYRKLLSSSLALDDITKIIVEFGEPFERFIRSLTCDDLIISEDEMELTKKTEKQAVSGTSAKCCAFGELTATPGYKYHWKMRVMSQGINIGIIEADFASSCLTECWWWKKYGYSYYNNGNKFTSSEVLSGGAQGYGDKFNEDDIVHVYLDLKEKCEVSWGKNETKYCKGFDLKKGMDYKMALGFYSGGIRLISCDVSE